MFPLPMQELLNQARLATLFGGVPAAPQQVTPQDNTALQDNTAPDNQPPPVFSSGTEAPSGPDITKFSPQTPMMDEYAKLMQSMPSEADYPAGGKGRRILAGLISLRARTPAEQQETIDRVMHPEYYQALGDWASRTKALGPAVTDEARINNMLRLATQSGNKSETDWYRAVTGRMAVDSREKLRQWQEDHPKGKIVAQKGGNLFVLDENNELQDTGISSGTLSDEDKQNLATTGRLKVVAAQTAGQKEVAGIRGAEARATKATPSGSTAAAKPESATQEKVRMYNNAKKAILENPDWAKWIHFDPSRPNEIIGVDNPTSRSGGFFGFGGQAGPDAETYQKIIQAIESQPQASAKPTTAAPSQKAAPVNQDDRVTIVDAVTGQKVATIPRADIPRLNTKKYKVQEMK